VNGTVVTTFKPELVDDARARLGEGPIWDAAEQRLYWIDILGRTLYVADGDGRRLESRRLATIPGTAMPAVGGGVLIADDQGLVLQDASGAERRLNDMLAGSPDLRFNDGKVDPRGRVFVGTLSMSGTPGVGALHRFGPDGGISTVLDRVSLSNGLGWSPDGATFYHVDTPTGAIDAYEYELSTGAIDRRRTFARIADTDGIPDGLCVDDDGGVWVALYGGSAVLRFDAEGRLDARVEFDVPNITSCGFGGPDRATLFITTASVDLDEAFLAEHPHAGGLYRVDVGRTGPSATLWGSA
jgi:sugar lactone lactonase YvrE